MAREQMMFGADFNEVAVSNAPTQEAQRNIANIESKGKAKIDTWNGFGKAVQGGMQLGANIINANKTIEADTAKSDYLNIVTSEGYLDADDTLRAEMFEGVYSTSTDRSDAYNTTFQGYSAGAYTKAFEGRAVEADNALYNASGPASIAWEGEASPIEDSTQDYSDMDSDTEYLTNKQAGRTKADFINDYVSANPRLDKTVVSRALMGEAYEEMLLTVQTADATPEALNEALANVEDIREPYKSPMFMTTKQKQGKEYISTMESKLNLAIKAKQKEIKVGAQTRIAEAKNAYTSNTSVGPNPMVLGSDITQAYDSPLAVQTAIASLDKSYTEQIERVNFLTNNTVTDRSIPIPDVAKKAWQEEVTLIATESFISGDYTTTIQAITNNPGYAKEIGDTIYQGFNQAETAEDLNDIMDKVLVMSSHDRGGTAIRQAIGEDEYKEMIIVHSLANSLYKGDLNGARRYYNDSKNNYNSFSKDLGGTIEKHQEKLGTQFAAYKNTMQAINNINPGIAASKESQIRDFYLTQNKEYGSIFKKKLKVDTSIAGDPFEKLSLMPEEDAKAFLAEIEEGSTVISLPNGTMQVKDEFGGTSRLINIDGYIKAKNTQVLKIKAIEGNPINVTDVLTSKAANVVDSVATSTEKIYDNIKSTVSKQLPGHIERFRGIFKSSSYEEAQKRLEELKALHSTKGTPQPDNDTREPVDVAQSEYAQQVNDRIVKVADTALEQIKENSIIKLPKKTKEAITNAVPLTLQEFTAIGNKDSTGLVTTQGYMTDKEGNLLPEGYVRKLGKIYRII